MFLEEPSHEIDGLRGVKSKFDILFY